MENTRIGKPEAITLILTVMANHAILNISKAILFSSESSALLNTIYVSIIALILSYIIYTLLNKFPTFDILDISNFLGGKVLKITVAILFSAYFIFFSATFFCSFFVPKLFLLIYHLLLSYTPLSSTPFSKPQWMALRHRNYCFSEHNYNPNLSQDLQTKFA